MEKAAAGLGAHGGSLAGAPVGHGHAALAAVGRGGSEEPADVVTAVKPGHGAATLLVGGGEEVRAAHGGAKTVPALPRRPHGAARRPPRPGLPAVGNGLPAALELLLVESETLVDRRGIHASSVLALAGALAALHDHQPRDVVVGDDVVTVVFVGVVVLGRRGTLGLFLGIVIPEILVHLKHLKLILDVATLVRTLRRRHGGTADVRLGSVALRVNLDKLRGELLHRLDRG